MKSNIKYLIYVVIGLIVIVWIQIMIPQPIDWTRSYKTTDKIPYGLYILNQEISELIAPTTVVKYDKTPYEYFKEELDSSKFQKESWLIIGNDYIDEESVYKILDAVQLGHDVFILSESNIYINPHLLDSLHLQTKYSTLNTIKLLNPHLYSSNFTLESNGEYFIIGDSTNLHILGVANDNKPNFIRKKIGEGHLYLGTNAPMFTNYHLLESNNHRYAESALSYINSEQLIWFDKSRNINAENQNIMRVVLSNKSLRWAWYFMLIGVLLFLFFNSKRKQRVIPIIKPKENKTVEFAKTIANLYYQEKNHADIIQKMINYFLEYVRTELRIDTQNLNEQFVHNLSKKTGSNTKDVEEAIQLINKYNTQKNKITEQDVTKLYLALEKIKGK